MGYPVCEAEITAFSAKAKVEKRIKSAPEPRASLAGAIKPGLPAGEAVCKAVFV
jgi:hypothetical protein